MGRPRKTLTANQAVEIEKLAEVLTMEQIADYFGISSDTLSRILNRQKDVSLHYKKGKAKIINEIAQNLVTKARGGDLGAMIFFLKTQGGWREKAELAHTVIPATPEPTLDFSKMSGHERNLFHQLLEKGMASEEKSIN